MTLSSLLLSLFALSVCCIECTQHRSTTKLLKHKAPPARRLYAYLCNIRRRPRTTLLLVLVVEALKALLILVVDNPLLLLLLLLIVILLVPLPLVLAPSLGGGRPRVVLVGELLPVRRAPRIAGGAVALLPPPK
eukprot:47693-Prorocentrum_minimum.AAC.1